MAAPRTTLEKDWYQTVSLEVRPALEAAVDAMADDARGLARSVAWGQGHGGHYADKIQGRTAIEHGRAIGYVIAGKPTSGWLEHGTVHMEGRHVLERTAVASGLDVTVSPRRNRSARRGTRLRQASA